MQLFMLTSEARFEGHFVTLSVCIPGHSVTLSEIRLHLIILTCISGHI